jgi:SAM-dependent methyltransferase
MFAYLGLSRSYGVREKLLCAILLSLSLFIDGQQRGNIASQPWHQDPNKWETGWKEGGWDYMAVVPFELSRNVITASVYGQLLAADGAVLDIGCAEGTMYKYLSPTQKNKYVGVDLAPTAIEKAKKSNPDGHFVTASAKDYVPDKTFDLIVFNDVMMFLKPDETVSRYRNYLKKGGYMVIAMFYQPDRNNNYDIDASFNAARQQMRLFDSMKVLGYVWHTGTTENKGEHVEKQRSSYRLEVYCNDLVSRRNLRYES